MIAASVAADRSRWFAFAFLLLALNGAVTLAATAVFTRGWAAAIVNLFEISAILWCAGAAGVALLLRAPAGERLRTGDRVLLAAAGAAALVPVPAVSAAMLSVLCLWAAATSVPASALRRAALIFLAITTSLLWGRLALGLGSGPLLAGESRLVGALTGLTGAGNVVPFAGGGYFVVAPGCSSLQGVSLAVVFWVTVTQYFAVALTPRAWATLAAAIAVAIAINLARLSAIALFPAWFDTLHVGFGATLFGWAALGSIVAATWFGLRDALVARG